ADFRYQVRRFLRRCAIRSESIIVRTLDNADPSLARAATDHWLSSISIRYGRPSRPIVRDFAKQFRTPVDAGLEAIPFNPEQVFGEVVEVGGAPRGLWVGQASSTHCLGIYVLIADTRVINLSDFMLLRAMATGRDCGVDYVNVGGSELATLFRFK